ncbi:DUF2752 domain-containing protein [Tsukamurella sp. 8J]|uniref:DUF2752 domain-containing protein n=1 Tax=Tsukamurella sp. 8J TaxID=3031962 RepID=UPI0023B9C962|nr:DUF2752 domain-containing protein [Tsukamurella sp. 8J]MDF0532581.1 DUF2752 domain-containing protein [Tsukamurella sp. 8J]
MCAADQTVPDRPAAGRPAVTARAGVRGPLLAAAGVAAVTGLLYVRDPHIHGSWGLCPLYAMTGIYCPACGGLRGVYDAVHGHLAAAVGSNVLLVPFAIVVVWAWSAWLGRGLGMRIAGPPKSAPWLIAVVVVTVVFTVARNLPGSPLAP